MNLRRVTTIFRKEIVDMLRDKRTLIAMIGLPVVLYPLLFIFGSQAALVQQDKLERDISQVAVAEGTDPLVRQWLEKIPKIAVLDKVATLADLYSGELDAIVGSTDDVDATLRSGKSVAVDIHFDGAETGSRQAHKRLQEGLRQQDVSLLDRRLAEKGLDSPFVHPLKIESRNVASASKTTGAILGAILPLVMVLMLGVGAFYPAIDLTAGEKERGTFETLLSTPTSTIEVVYGKFLTVFCLAMLAGLLNLGSLLLTLGFQLAQMSDSMGGLAISISPWAALLMFLVFVPLALLISAVMMTVAMFARSFKEAQNLMTPFFILIMFPAMLGAIPGTELTPAFHLVPIANAALLFKALMMGKGTPEAVFAVFVSTTAYAVLALMCATWIFKREEIILAEDRGIPVTWRRSAFLPRSAPTPGMAFFLYCLCLMLLFYAGSYIQQRLGVAGVMLTQWVLILAPTLLLLWYTRVDLRETLNLRVPRPAAFLGTVVMAGAWVVLVVQLSYWQGKLLPAPKALEEEMQRLAQAGEGPWALAGRIAAIALSPAICEEILFRGAILSGLRPRLPAWAVILLVGLLFGVLHITIYRVPVTALSGMVLAYMVLRSGSIYTSMVAHFILNTSALVAASRLSDLLDRWRLDEHGVPYGILGLALVTFMLGIAVLEGSVQNRRPPSPSG